MIDHKAMLGKAQYCAEMAEKSLHHEMREHWRHASDAWFYAARTTTKTSRVIDEWDWIKSNEASLTPPE